MTFSDTHGILFPTSNFFLIKINYGCGNYISANLLNKCRGKDDLFKFSLAHFYSGHSAYVGRYSLSILSPTRSTETSSLK